MKMGEKWCDYCNREVAILYCRADAAKLCLLCDQHVHSANPLSLKHIRSQICNNCHSQPVSIFCSSHNLLLCHDCDYDTHSSITTPTHLRTPSLIEFTGSPSASHLASAWGILNLYASCPNHNNINNKHTSSTNIQQQQDDDEYDDDADEFMVPTTTNYNFQFGGFPQKEEEEEKKGLPGTSTSTTSTTTPTSPATCGKQRHILLKQLIQLSHTQQHIQIHTNNNDNDNDDDVAVVVEEEDGQTYISQQQLPFTSLLMQQQQGCSDQLNAASHDDDQSFDGQMLWNTHPSDQGTQIWDFNLGRLRGSGPLEDLSEGANHAGFTVKGYSELLSEASLEDTARLRQVYGINCSMTHDNFVSFKNDRNNPVAGPTTSESNNMPIVRESSHLGFGIPNGSKDTRVVEQIMRCENTTSAKKTDLELMAKNRGNAMLRYKEKKKTRRYDKHIRYESRKARADTRKRVKGRFVKASDPPDS